MSEGSSGGSTSASFAHGVARFVGRIALTGGSTWGMRFDLSK